MTTPKPKYRASGFTLIELMVTVALAAILAYVAIPNLSAFVRNAELTSATNALVAAMGTARSEALKLNYNAVVVPASGNSWESGWIVFVDKNFNNTFDPATESVISRQAALPAYFTITALPASSTPYVLFNASGYSQNSTGGFGASNFTIARNDLPAGSKELLEQTRRTIIASTGRVRTCKPTSTADTNCPSSGS